MTPRQMVEAQITAAKLKPAERRLALSLLECADDNGYVLTSTRHLYRQIEDMGPDQGEYVPGTNGVKILNALKALCEAGILAFTWSWPIYADVSCAFMAWEKEGANVNSK
jgi:DNA-directed RNA polymerase specialized sigma54-like protein